MSNPKISTIENEYILLRRYLEDKEAYEILKKRLEAQRERILKQCEPGQYDDCLLMIETKTRSCFDWTAAKKSLPEDVKETLETEFTKTIEYTEMKVKKIGRPRNRRSDDQ